MKRGGRILAVLLLAGLLSGCSSLAKAEQTTVSVSAKGSVTEVLVEKSSPSEEELANIREFLEKEAETYNENSKQGKIQKKEPQVKDGYLRIEVKYDSWKDYAAYHNTKFFCGTVADAVKMGYDFAGSFLTAAEEKKDGSAVLKDYADRKVVILHEPVEVWVPGTILCVSENVKKKEKKSAEIQMEAKDSNSVFQTSLEAPAYIIYK